MTKKPLIIRQLAAQCKKHKVKFNYSLSRSIVVYHQPKGLLHISLPPDSGGYVRVITDYTNSNHLEHQIFAPTITLLMAKLIYKRMLNPENFDL